MNEQAYYFDDFPEIYVLAAVEWANQCIWKLGWNGAQGFCELVVVNSSNGYRGIGACRSAIPLLCCNRMEHRRVIKTVLDAFADGFVDLVCALSSSTFAANSCRISTDFDCFMIDPQAESI